jgi:hypothetical protein
MNGTTVRQDDFDTVLVAELETLRESEKRLERLYRRLLRKPHLRESFLCELSEVQQRTERLDAVLNPLEFFKAPALPFAGPSLMPAA